MTGGPALLTGEAAVAAFLLAGRGTKETDQTVGLHFECSGPIRRIMAFGRNDGGIRGHAGDPKARWEGSLNDGKGTGMLTVSRFQDFSRKIYSSSVEFRKQSIAKNIEEFTGRSEQIQVFIHLGPFTEAATGIFGLLFEAMPGAGAAETDGLLDWVEHNSLPARLSAGEYMNTLPGMEVLFRGRMHFFCDCSQEKVERMIQGVGEEEARAVLDERGEIEVICEFCREKYTLGQTDLERIFC